MHIIFQPKDKRPRRIKNLDPEILKNFIDIPVCPLCGKEIKHDIIEYLGGWIADKNESLICSYRVCPSCASLLKRDKNLAQSKNVWTQIENTLVFYNSNLPVFLEKYTGVIADGNKSNLPN